MGIIDHIQEMFTVSSTRKSKKPFKTVNIRVKLDCDGCERKVRNAVSSLKGARSVEVDRKQNRVTVRGYVDQNKVLRKVRRTGKKTAMFWPYVEQNLTYYPYAPGAYDKKAPSGFVRNVYQAYPSDPNDPTEKYATIFSDENVHACSIM